jgi:hypothetical protein
MSNNALYSRLRSFAVEVREFARRPWIDRHARPHWALEGEDVVMQLLVQDIRRGIYIDVGAHMPRRWSTTYGLYRRGWRGLLIEPTPDLARGLRHGRPRDVVEECGVGSQPGTQDFYVFDAPSCSTFDRGQADALLASRNPPRLLRIIQRPIRRLDEIMEQHQDLVGKAADQDRRRGSRRRRSPISEVGFVSAAGRGGRSPRGDGGICSRHRGCHLSQDAGL